MRCLYNRTILFIWLMLISISGSAWGNIQDVIGSWMGTVGVSDVELRVAFTIQVDQDGSLTATLDSPDQGVYDIPIDEIHYEDHQLGLLRPWWPRRSSPLP